MCRGLVLLLSLSLALSRLNEAHHPVAFRPKPTQGRCIILSCTVVVTAGTEKIIIALLVMLAVGRWAGVCRLSAFSKCCYDVPDERLVDDWA